MVVVDCSSLKNKFKEITVILREKIMERVN